MNAINKSILVQLLMGFMKKRPQMTRREIEYVKSLSASNLQIIEFGSGLSTLEWAGSFAQVISVETRAEWFRKIKTLAEPNNNVKLIFSPPESCAYGEDGEELWNSRVPSDYGSEVEFEGYLETAKRIINSQRHACVIFIDANMRTEILEIALNSKTNHEILVHDVIPERQYLNPWVTRFADCIIKQVDSLVHLKRL